ncbi:MAG: type II toxin-antitoxin system VapC family toxin [Ignavibacteriales bacterium]|nr:type II toxin-antitoxin system VapC family toxin [Ignavibacteriales bacterium]
MSYLLDSNIIIYSAKPQNSFLREFIAKNSPYLSHLSYLEVLGYNLLTKEEKILFEKFFNESRLLPISKEIIDTAISLKQIKKMSIGDSIIAATALKNKLILVTRNSKDFSWINRLRIINPFEKVL